MADSSWEIRYSKYVGTLTVFDPKIGEHEYSLTKHEDFTWGHYKANNQLCLFSAKNAEKHFPWIENLAKEEIIGKARLMLIWSDYYKDLGYKKTDYPFTDNENLKDISFDRGIIPAETWNLDSTILLFLYAHLCYFRDNTIAYPVHVASMEEWLEIVNTIIDGIGNWLKKGKDDTADCTEQDEERLDKSLDLLKEYLCDLWW